MPERRRNGPYIWVTWLTRLLAGENHCEWASHFRAHHYSNSWAKAPSDFNLAKWQMQHTVALSKERTRWTQKGYRVYLEGQNSFVLSGKSAQLAGKPDLIAQKGNTAIIIDVKTGQPRESDLVQVLVYLYAVPLALRRQYEGVSFSGQVVYGSHVVKVPVAQVDEAFKSNMAALIQRLAAAEPPPRVPSAGECGWCPITLADCVERIEGTTSGASTTDF